MLFAKWSPILRTIHFGKLWNPICRRHLLTLAIESSCDDTSVAVLSTRENSTSDLPIAKLLYHEKVTANNAEYRGIHPLNSAESHQIHLPGLVQEALRHLPQTDGQDPLRSFTLPSLAGGPPTRHVKPTFITATRGPGMRSCLATGLDTAKGLCLALNVPLTGVHHMQAHALTPRLVSALETPGASTGGGAEYMPKFPFLTLLVSGGHTLLLKSTSLTDHTELASTIDIAAGDCIDKLARHILPPTLLAVHKADTNYGRLLEAFAFPSTSPQDYPYNYTPAGTRAAILSPRPTRWGWAISPPLSHTHSAAFSFSGLQSTIARIAEHGTNLLAESRGRLREQPMCEDERRNLAQEAQRVLFEHLADRVCSALEGVRAETGEMPSTVVVSGGVAANQFLRVVLRECVRARLSKGVLRGNEVRFSFPPADLCTDNAAMIAWAGVEMWQAGWESEMGVKVEKRWSMGHGGILGVGGWKRREATLDSDLHAVNGDRIEEPRQTTRPPLEEVLPETETKSTPRPQTRQQRQRETVPRLPKSKKRKRHPSRNHRRHRYRSRRFLAPFQPPSN